MDKRPQIFHHFVSDEFTLVDEHFQSIDDIHHIVTWFDDLINWQSKASDPLSLHVCQKLWFLGDEECALHQILQSVMLFIDC